MSRYSPCGASKLTPPNRKGRAEPLVICSSTRPTTDKGATDHKSTSDPTEIVVPRCDCQLSNSATIAQLYEHQSCICGFLRFERCICTSCISSSCCHYCIVLLSLLYRPVVTCTVLLFVSCLSYHIVVCLCRIAVSCYVENSM